jgi:hypothetical protein
MVKIPLSLPAAALAAAAQRPAAPQESNDPASAISSAGDRIIEAYRAYDDLRALTSQLNGLHDSDPLPAHIAIDKITINFSVNGLGRSATCRSVKRVGDLAPLLAQETERLISVIRDSAVHAREAAGVIEALCSRSQYAVNAQRSGTP